MAVMRKLFIISVCIFLPMVFVCASSEDLRVYSIIPACFEYKFTSIVTEKPSGPVFALNHLNGRTHFVEIGDTVGPYRVKSYQPVEAGSLILEDSDGSAIPLTLNETRADEGFMVRLISLKTGQKQLARKDDNFFLGGNNIRVLDVEKNAVRANINGAIQNVSLISDVETAALKMMCDERVSRQRKADKIELAKKAQKAQQLEQTLSRLEAAQQARRPQNMTWETRGGSSSRFAYGATYPMPIEYQVVPIWGRLPCGRLGYQPITVPTRFRRQQTGFSISYHR